MELYLRSTHLCLVLFSLQLLHGLHANTDSLYHMCSRPSNFTANGLFSKNLNQLFISLSKKVPVRGFGIGSVGKSPDRVNALALCRGDVSSSNCKACIASAITDIHDLCPYKEEAIIWFDNCLLRYSDADFFGEIDTTNRFYMWNVNGVKDDPASFNQKTKELLHHLSLEAHLSPLLYAAGDVEIGEDEKLYGLAQCTRDLSGGDCNKCLESAISELPTCCDGKRGGRVIGGSCNIRYELYPFVDA